MKKILLAVVMVCLGFTAAWGFQGPCSVVGRNVMFPKGQLSNWQPATAMFSPAPECAGTVEFVWDDGRKVTEPYEGAGGTLDIGGLICNLSDNGTLIYDNAGYNYLIENYGWLKMGFPQKQLRQMYQAAMNLPPWPENFTEIPQIRYSDRFSAYGYTLTNWLPDDGFSPKPQNAGTVTLISPNGSVTLLPYTQTGAGEALVAGCPCKLVNGDLRCDIIQHDYFTAKKQR